MISPESFSAIVNAIGMSECVSFGGRYFIPRDALIRFLASLTQPPPELEISGDTIKWTYPTGDEETKP